MAKLITHMQQCYLMLELVRPSDLLVQRSCRWFHQAGNRGSEGEAGVGVPGVVEYREANGQQVDCIKGDGV
jgi:hypothetical protein